LPLVVPLHIADACPAAAAASDAVSLPL
jgi:hypothetical protein